MLAPLLSGEPSTVDVLEQTTPTYKGLVTDGQGNALPAASLATLTLSLYDIESSGTIVYINGRHSQNVLNANNVTVDTNGNLVWSIQVADTTLQEVLVQERHYALFTWTWVSAAGTETGRHLVILNVIHLVTVS